MLEKWLEEKKERIRTMAAFGIPEAEIAHRLGIPDEILRDEFAEILDNAGREANEKVMQTLYQMAISGKHPAATMWWAKTHCCWNPRLRHAVRLDDPYDDDQPADSDVYSNGDEPIREG